MAVKKQSRAFRWADACSRASSAVGELVDLQSEFQDWRDSLPENLAASPVGEKLDAICDIDLEAAQSAVEDAESADLPLGFGRD